MKVWKRLLYCNRRLWMRFVKMQGLGNDYVYVDIRKEKVEYPEELARKLSDRHFGIGADGLILIGDSECGDVRMEMYNADGSRGKMCGNGIRCVAKYAYDHELVRGRTIRIETLSGIRKAEILSDGDVTIVRVDMGGPEIVELGEEADYISMGNPHAVRYEDEIEKLNLAKIGPVWERRSGMKERVNVEFVKVLDRRRMKMRVWERGSGETLACGTGACAAAVSAIARNLTEREVRITLLGGELLVEWTESGEIYMTGPAVTVFEGEILS